jgi:hypothetical protein
MPLEAPPAMPGPAQQLAPALALVRVRARARVLARAQGLAQVPAPAPLTAAVHPTAHLVEVAAPPQSQSQSAG